MTDTGAKHRDADELFVLGSSALESNVLTHEQRIEIDERMSELRTRWDGLNIDVIEHEKRLVTVYSILVGRLSFQVFMQLRMKNRIQKKVLNDGWFWLKIPNEMLSFSNF